MKKILIIVIVLTVLAGWGNTTHAAGFFSTVGSFITGGLAGPGTDAGVNAGISAASSVRSAIVDKIDTTYTPLYNIPGVTDPATTNTKGISDYIPWLYTTTISLSIMLAVIMFTWHAFQYMVSDTSLGNKQAAKDGMWNVIIGLVLIFSAYLILQTINPDLVKKFSIDTSAVPPPEAPAIPTIDPQTSCDSIGSTYAATTHGIWVELNIHCVGGAGSPTNNIISGYLWYRGNSVADCVAALHKDPKYNPFVTPGCTIK